MRLLILAALATTLAAALGSALPKPADAYDPAHLKRLLAEKRCPGCDLSGAQIVDEDMRKAYLPGANLAGANLTVTNFSEANLSGANLEGADLTLGVLTSTILDGANLKNAIVDNADFTGAHLSGADVTGVVWDKAAGADLSQAKGVKAGVTPPPPAPAPAPQVKLSSAPGTMKGQRFGTTMLMATTYCPAGTLEANGATLGIQEHVELFSLYGTTYGGDGRTSFVLPDLRATVPVAGLRYCIVADGAWPSRF